ncbi:hypothetical protein [Fodinicola feengrottensis]|uniref:Uncharacterized protein n=1 Tax=Fodinicola feengrottensis TaxID=435914 RepID=A0ABP4UMH2_9ACTN|nr:hypothetical protein [Fodinicola feengrottensis]
MSARGAEAILKAKGLTPPKPKPINGPGSDSGDSAKPQEDGSGTTPNRAVRGTARQQVTDENIRPKLNAAKEAADEAEDDGSGRASAVGEKVGKAVGQPIGAGLSMGNEAAGFILGLMVWGWVVRPFLQKGVPGVKAVLMAKFFNKKADGSDLT